MLLWSSDITPPIKLYFKGQSCLFLLIAFNLKSKTSIEIVNIFLLPLLQMCNVTTDFVYNYFNLNIIELPIYRFIFCILFDIFFHVI